MFLNKKEKIIGAPTQGHPRGCGRLNKSLTNNNLGFTLTSILIASAISGMLFVAVLQMLSFQHKEVDYLKQQLVGMSVKYSILQALRKPGTCNCHFAQTPGTDGNGKPLGPFTVKTPTTTTDPYTTPDINLGSFRTSCDFSSSDNIIAASGQKVSGSKLLIRTVKINNILPSGTSHYQGDLTVEYSIEGNSRVPAPITTQLLLAGEPTGSGTDQIKNCGGGTRVAVNQGPAVTYVYTRSNRCGGAKYGDCVCANADTRAAGLWIGCPVGYVIGEINMLTGTTGWRSYFSPPPPSPPRTV